MDQRELPSHAIWPGDERSGSERRESRRLGFQRELRRRVVRSAVSRVEAEGRGRGDER